MNTETRTCQNCKNQFVIEPDDFVFYEKIKVPPPTWCPECRMKRRMAWRNEHTLFRVKDAASGKEIFAGFSPHAPIKVYDKDYWLSDAWDPMAYGRDYDFSRSFFEQLRTLMSETPWPSKSVQMMENSDYCDQAGFFKNAYLCFNGDKVEDSAYTYRCTNIRNSFDLTQSIENELCYESVSVSGCYRAFFSHDCESSTNIWFSKNLSGCNNCFGCANLRNKSYYIFNQPYSKEEYEKRFADMRLSSWRALQDTHAKAGQHIRTYPVKYYRGVRAINSSGDYLRNTSNVRESFSIDNAQDMKYCQFLYMGTKDSYDYNSWGSRSSRMYECQTCGEQCDSLKFCFDCWPGCRNLEYSISCRSSSDLFGCFGLRKKQYCILNKQYTKGEYQALRRRIIHHMSEMPYTDKRGAAYAYGEFFPAEFSPHAYNESLLQDFYPLTESEAIRQGHVWRSPEAKEFETTVHSEDLPDTIENVSDAILKETIQCSDCRKAYRIIPIELAFLRQSNLPLPRQCVACRAARRFALLNPPKYYQRSCACVGNGSVPHDHTGQCPTGFKTSYAPERSEIVYCESCYNAEVA